jgi:hypothetical protein
MSAMGGKLTTGPVGPGSTSPVRGALAQRVNAPGLIEAIPLDQAGAQERLSVTGCLEEDQVILEPGVIFPAARAFEPNKHGIHASIAGACNWSEKQPSKMGYQSKSTVLGAKPHLPPSLTSPSRRIVNSGDLQ